MNHIDKGIEHQQVNENSPVVGRKNFGAPNSDRIKSNFLRKVSAAWRFRKLTLSILRLKLFERANRFLAGRGWRLKPLTTPLGIIIRTTERCFLKCDMCGQNGQEGRYVGIANAKRDTVDPELYSRLLDDIKTWKLKPFVKFTGGEPLTEWKSYQPFIEGLVAAGSIVKVNTNGVLLNKKSFAEEIVRTGVHYISISIDGDEETHSKVRGLDSAFSSAREGVQNILEARKKLGTNYPMILISCVVSTWNQEKLGALQDLAYDWGVDWLNFQFLNYITPERSDEASQVAQDCFGETDRPWDGFMIPGLTYVDTDLIANTIAEIKRDAPCPVTVMNVGGETSEHIKTYYYTDDVISSHICHMPFATMFVTPPGEAVYCIDYPYYFYADLMKEKASDAWFNESSMKFRREIIQHYKQTGRNFPQCLRCNWPYN